jgi:hypothetical protein
MDDKLRDFMKQAYLSRFRLMAKTDPAPANDYNRYVGDTVLAYAEACETQTALTAEDNEALREMKAAVLANFNHMAQWGPGLDFRANDALAICGRAYTRIDSLQQRFPQPA